MKTTCRVTALLQAMVMAFSLAGCSSETNSAQTEAPQTETSQTETSQSEQDTSAAVATGMKDLPVISDTPELSVWYKIEPEGAVCSDGSQWSGMYRKGSENKVLFYFFGGGVSVDEYTATMTYSEKGARMFYVDDMTTYDETGVFDVESTFASSKESNPFRDWTIVVIPYATGDFHCGTGDFEYTGDDGQKHILYHHGYTNFRLFMEQLLPILETPEAIVISGSSAGGFGASILSNELAGMFPETENVTVSVDASLLLSDRFAEYAEKVWQAPEEIVSRIKSPNLSLSMLEELHRNKPYVKILFGCSAFDEALSSYQYYFDTGERTALNKELIDTFHSNLKAMTEEFRTNIPEGGLFIWNDYVTDETLGSTEHTIQVSTYFLDDLGGHGSYAQWIMDAVNGTINTYGLELLN